MFLMEQCYLHLRWHSFQTCVCVRVLSSPSWVIMWVRTTVKCFQHVRKVSVGGKGKPSAGAGLTCRGKSHPGRCLSDSSLRGKNYDIIIPLVLVSGSFDLPSGGIWKNLLWYGRWFLLANLTWFYFCIWIRRSW